MEYIIQETKDGDFAYKTVSLDNPSSLSSLSSELAMRVIKQLSNGPSCALDVARMLKIHEQKVYYHMRNLEKAGIIKPKVPVVTGVTGRALKVIEKVAKEKNAPLIKVNTQTKEKALKSDVFSNSTLPIDIFRSASSGFTFSNKLLALAAVKTLGVSINGDQVIKAFSSTFPGRFEEIENGVILDGAHNPQKIKFLINFLREFTVGGSQFTVILVVAFKKDKKWKKMVDLLIKNLPIQKIIATKFQTPTDTGFVQSVDPKEIADYVRHYKGFSFVDFVDVVSNSHEAVFEAVNCQLSIVNCLILITGSLYLVGEVRTIWELPKF